MRLNVKWSLQELSRAINGDGKNSPNPLFRIKVVLEGNQVEFSPKLKTLANVINSISKDVTATLSVVQRLLDLLTPIKSKKRVCEVNILPRLVYFWDKVMHYY